MNTTKEQRKAKAIELMKKLDIYTPYIKDFTDKDWVCFFEFFGGYWAFQLEGLQEKIKEIEEIVFQLLLFWLIVVISFE